ncbi:MAG TPA: hypothetical protein VK599_07075 [Streptosporangiaceae bacterium]|nr:hypothetical protein [Streptosporangiaceae bacterium]
MPDPQTIYAGQRVTAAYLDSVPPVVAVKTSDQQVTSHTSFVNDNTLKLPCAAGAIYMVMMELDYEGGTQGSSDIQWNWNLPAGATLRLFTAWNNTSGVAQVGMKTGSTTVTAGTQGAANVCGAFMHGTLFCGSSDGTIQFQWAQNTSSATPTIVHAQSVLAMWRQQ